MLWWTFQNLVIASVLAALVWLACRSGRVGPVGRHALWLVVLVKLLTPPLVVWPWAVHEPDRVDEAAGSGRAGSCGGARRPCSASSGGCFSTCAGTHVRRGR